MEGALEWRNSRRVRERERYGHESLVSRHKELGRVERRERLALSSLGRHIFSSAER